MRIFKRKVYFIATWCFANLLLSYSFFPGATNNDSNSVRPFSLVLIEASSDSLPKAHTCFNRLDIPLYESQTKFCQKLTQAMNETIGFHTDWNLFNPLTALSPMSEALLRWLCLAISFGPYDLVIMTIKSSSEYFRPQAFLFTLNLFFCNRLTSSLYLPATKSLNLKKSIIIFLR